MHSFSHGRAAPTSSLANRLQNQARVNTSAATARRQRSKFSEEPSPQALPFNLSSVQTSAPYQDLAKGNRHFGLEEGKTFYPTPKEFADPYMFFEKIREEGERYGIVKVIPPEGWKPSFKLDPQTFRFKTRVQRVNTMEGETRVKLNYIEQLRLFHSMYGNSLKRLPLLDRAPIDLYLLAKAVRSRSGPKAVTEKKQWAEVSREIRPGGYSQKCTSASKTVKECFYEFIEPFERYVSQARKFKKQLASKEAPKKDPSASSSSCKDCRICEEKIQHRKDCLLCAENCGRLFHCECLDLKKPIKGSHFYCPFCLLEIGTQFGFEDGAQYSLGEFQTKANNFKQQYLVKHPLPEGVSLEDHMEAEFWRLAHSMSEDLDVEYGSDINAFEYGSAFPDPEKNPLDPYSISPWNLRNLPRHYGSLLHLIQPEIPGMMVPWLYIGMSFAAFSWHVEDHYTYSINYMHFGETKTWYGIPASDSDKFEKVARSLLPELFEDQPDLLSHLTTIINPGKLIAKSVEVFAIDQRPNQFIITYPRAYHAGFNQGFNCNEAVNFAQTDWVPYGKDSIEMYKNIGREPVFPHEKLMFELALKNYHNPREVAWLREPVTEICNKELDMRCQVLADLPHLRPKHETIDRDDPHITCMICKAYCSLSQVASLCKPAVVCLQHAKDHYSVICKCGKSCQYLRLRYLDGHLKSLVEQLQRTNEMTMQWMTNYKKFWEEMRQPSIETMQRWWREAEYLQMPVDVSHLGNFIDLSLQWTNRVNKLLMEIDSHILPSQISQEQENGFNGLVFLEKWKERVQNCVAEEEEGIERFCCCESVDGSGFSVQCDDCSTWYHGRCIGVSEEDIVEEMEWFCEICDARRGGFKWCSLVEEVMQLTQEAKRFLFTSPFSHEFVGVVSPVEKFVMKHSSSRLMGEDGHITRKAFGMGLVWPVSTSSPSYLGKRAREDGEEKKRKLKLT